MSVLSKTLRRPVAGVLAAASLAVACSGLTALPAQAAGGQRVLLRTLVVSSGDPATQALAVELDREGIPYTMVSLAAAGRPVIDAAYLEDAATGTARYQAVFLPNSSLHNSYTILSAAGGRTGAFGALITNGLPAAFSASLSYTSTDALPMRRQPSHLETSRRQIG